MKGKIGIVIGLGAGYVLGSRAGRERYEQIKTQADKIWSSAPVQKQVVRAQDLAKTSIMAVPGAVWDGAVKVTKAVSKQGTTKQKVDAAVKAGRSSVADVKKATAQSMNDISQAADEAVADVKAASQTPPSTTVGHN